MDGEAHVISEHEETETKNEDYETRELENIMINVC